MIITPIQIVSINMRRMNFLLPAFLQSTPASIVLVQEVWFGRISTLRSDTDPDGVAVYGPPKHDDWDCILPQYSGDEKCRVACYIRKSLSLSPDTLIFPRLDHPIASRDSQVIEVTISGTVFLLVNIYHSVRNRKPSLSHILPHPLDAFTPTLVVGDFNTHSSTWSLPGATVSSWATPLEEWFEESDLLLANPAGAAMRKGTRSENRSERDSVIDLFLLNESALCTGRFSPVSISFEDSLGSDHAAISIFWSPPLEPTPYSPTTLPGFIIDDNLKDEWIKDFSLLPTPTVSSLSSLTAAADTLDTDIYAVSGKYFKRRHTPDFRGLRWWNVHCEAALTCVASTRGKSRVTAIRNLRQTIREAKRAWSADFLDHTTADRLWTATRWRHGRRVNHIPPLLKASGDLGTTTAEIHSVLVERFFPTVPVPILAAHPDDPPPFPTRVFSPITEEEVSNALANTSNSSAPGLTGIGYKLLKWCHSASPSRLTTLFNGATTLGHHPWRDAKVVPIPKPHKADYRVGKSYRPISLLECCSKLLEKIVAKRILLDANRYHLLPAGQFGSRDFHSVVDAAMCLTHSIQSCVKTGHVGALILFDIQGFFDNLHVNRLVHIFSSLGFDAHLCEWVRSFLTDRRVTLTINGEESPALLLSHGTPQGSPLSPILSAIYLIPLLRLAESWKFHGLTTYVDDGSIFATGPTHKIATDRAASALRSVTEWLSRNGLGIDMDKTEYISFQPPRTPP